MYDGPFLKKEEKSTQNLKKNKKYTNNIPRVGFEPTT